MPSCPLDPLPAHQQAHYHVINDTQGFSPLQRENMRGPTIRPAPPMRQCRPPWPLVRRQPHHPPTTPPSNYAPQHHRESAESIAHVCLSPADTAFQEVTLVGTTTAVGIVKKDPVVEPVPSLPLAWLPAPCEAHTMNGAGLGRRGWRASTHARACVPNTRPLAAGPRGHAPQHHKEPSEASAHVWWPVPAAMEPPADTCAQAVTPVGATTAVGMA